MITPTVPSLQFAHREAGGIILRRTTKGEISPRLLQLSHLPRKISPSFSLDHMLTSNGRCQKPFPDKTFYVFDGKPFCDYHYHEANNSLCAAPDCGRPIEGPCAVSHTGERYHIEHLTCEYEDDEYGERCEEGLIDYWEVEGRMLCERHMRQVTEQDMMDSDAGMDEIRTNADLRAMKRKTRFIDIAGLR